MDDQKKDAINFLRAAGMLDSDKEQFIIRYPDGREVDLVEQLAKFGYQQYWDGYQAGKPDEM